MSSSTTNNNNSNNSSSSNNNNGSNTSQAPGPPHPAPPPLTCPFLVHPVNPTGRIPNDPLENHIRSEAVPNLRHIHWVPPPTPPTGLGEADVLAWVEAHNVIRMLDTLQQDVFPRRTSRRDVWIYYQAHLAGRSRNWGGGLKFPSLQNFKSLFDLRARARRFLKERYPEEDPGDDEPQGILSRKRDRDEDDDDNDEAGAGSAGKRQRGSGSSGGIGGSATTGAMLST